MMTNLTNKQKAFIAEYIKDLNGTQAVYRAGYKVSDDNTAAAIAYENLRKPHIKAEIDHFIDESIMSAREVLYHLTQIARSDIGDVLDSFGTPDIEMARQSGKTSLIKKIKTKTIYGKDESEIHQIELELYDRLSALDKLSKFHELTTTTRQKDWHDELIDAIKQGLNYEVVQRSLEAYGEPVTLADELFRLAGVPIQ